MMKIVNCGYDYRHDETFRINRPSGTGDCILLILRSPGFFVFEGKTHRSRGNAVVLFKKDTPQIYGADGAEFINDWVHFEAEEGDMGRYEALGLPFDRVLEFENVNEFSKLIKNIFFEKYSQNKNNTESAKLYFELIMLKISDLLDKNDMTYSALSEKLSELRNAIYSNPQRDWSVEKIAKELSVSLSYLQHRYKQLFGNSIKKDVTLSRTEYAKYLLYSTDYTVSAVSSLCGYENDVHFMRIFKKETGYTPTKYREAKSISSEKVKESKRYIPFSL